MEIAYVSSELDQLQRAACIMIIEAMRTIPIKVLKILLDLLQFGAAVETADLVAAYRLLRPHQGVLKIKPTEFG